MVPNSPTAQPRLPSKKCTPLSGSGWPDLCTFQVAPRSSLHSTAEPGRPTTHTLSSTQQTAWKSQVASTSGDNLVSVKPQPPPADLLSRIRPPWPTANDLALRSCRERKF